MSVSRKLNDEIVYSRVPADLIAQMVEFGVKHKLDPSETYDHQTWLDGVHRAVVDGDLEGIRTSQDRLRKYGMDDVLNVLASATFKRMYAQAKAAVVAQAKVRKIDDQRAVREQARLAAEVAAERKLVPHLYALFDELAAEVAAQRR